jgi:hypothetical protein
MWTASAGRSAAECGGCANRRLGKFGTVTRQKWNIVQNKSNCCSSATARGRENRQSGLRQFAGRARCGRRLVRGRTKRTSRSGLCVGLGRFETQDRDVLGPLVSDAFLNRATHSDILRDQFAIRIIRSGETVREDCRASPSRAIVRSTSEIDLAKGVPIAQGASHSAGARKPEADGLILLFLIRGEAEYAQNGPSQTLIPGDAIVLNRGKADSLAASEGELECLAMCVSKAKITRALAKKVADGPLFLSRDSLAAQILSGYVRSYFAASQERCDPAIDRLFCAHVSDLLTLAVESSARAVGPRLASPNDTFANYWKRRRKPFPGTCRSAGSITHSSFSPIQRRNVSA